jgi:hypothetical protein
MMRAPVI